MKKRICPKCGERLFASVRECPNCNTSLAQADIIDVAEPTAKERAENIKITSSTSQKLKCVSCGAKLEKRSPFCPTCGADFSKNISTINNSTINSNMNDDTENPTPLYIVSALIPLAGIIIGAIKLSSNSNSHVGKFCLGLGVFVPLACGLLTYFILSI